MADVVIIADGTNAKARQYVTAVPPVRTGTYYVPGEIYQPELACPAMTELVGGGNLAAVEACKSLFLHTKSNGHLSFYASFRLPAAERIHTQEENFALQMAQMMQNREADREKKWR